MASLAFAADIQKGMANDGGIVVDWRYEADPANPGLGALDIRITDAAARQPIAYPRGAILGWLQRDRAALSDVETSCLQKAKTFATQGVGRRSTIDLNEYRIVTLNRDGSVAFIDPFVGFNNAKLEAVVDLGATPLDWLNLEDRMTSWVLVGDPLRLIGLDLQSRKVVVTILLPDGAKADRLAGDRDGKRVMVPMPGLSRLGLADVSAATPALRYLDVPGLERLFRVEGEDGRVSPDLADAALELSGNRIAFFRGDHVSAPWPVKGPVVSVAASALVNRYIIVTANGVVHQAGIGSERPDPAAPDLQLSHPVAAARLFDGGRRLFAIGGGRGSIVDLAANTVSMEVATVAKADQILETGTFLYALSSEAGRATLLSTEDLRRGRNQATEVMVSSAGPADPALVPGQPSRAIVAPEGNGILFASDTDGMIYQYSEGMMVPVGSYSNYRRAAVGLAVVDYSLKPVSPGHYRGVVRSAEGGRYELVLAGAKPRFAICASLRLTGSETAAPQEAPRLKAELVAGPDSEGPDPAGDGETIRLRVLEYRSGTKPAALSGLRDLSLLVFDRHTGWQKRSHLRESGDGVYETTVKVPRASRYAVMASSSTANLSFVEGSLGEITLGATP